MHRPRAAIFDMDGTLVDVSHLRHYVQGGRENGFKKDFDAFHSETVNCNPINWVLRTLRFHHHLGYKVLIVTARSDRYYQHTAFWLAFHDVPHHELFMRKQGDYRPDYEVKKDILYRIRQAYNPVIAYDDNPNVIKLWKEEGIQTKIVPGWEDTN